MRMMGWKITFEINFSRVLTCLFDGYISENENNLGDFYTVEITENFSATSLKLITSFKYSPQPNRMIIQSNCKTSHLYNLRTAQHRQN